MDPHRRGNPVGGRRFRAFLGHALLETGRRLSKVRILTALLLARLQRSKLYHERQAPEFSFTSLDGPTVIAHDGEVGSAHESASFSAMYRVLPVFRPLPRQ